MNINATAASRIVWVMDNNWASQFSEEDSGAVRLIIDSIMEDIGKTALRCERELEVPWAVPPTDSNIPVRQEVEDYLTHRMGYIVEEHFYGGANDGFVIKW